MKIERVKRYKYKGIEFDSLKAIKEHISDEVGEQVVNKIMEVTKNFAPSDALKIQNILLSKEVRESLIELYNVTITQKVTNVDTCGYAETSKETLNILDLSL